MLGRFPQSSLSQSAAQTAEHIPLFKKSSRILPEENGNVGRTMPCKKLKINPPSILVAVKTSQFHNIKKNKNKKKIWFGRNLTLSSRFLNRAVFLEQLLKLFDLLRAELARGGGIAQFVLNKEPE